MASLNWRGILFLAFVAWLMLGLFSDNQKMIIRYNDLKESFEDLSAKHDVLMLRCQIEECFWQAEEYLFPDRPSKTTRMNFCFRYKDDGLVMDIKSAVLIDESGRIFGQFGPITSGNHQLFSLDQDFAKIDRPHFLTIQLTSDEKIKFEAMTPSWDVLKRWSKLPINSLRYHYIPPPPDK